MIKKLKKTETYKWIHQDRYDKWFDNCEFTDFRKLQVPNFVDECLSTNKFEINNGESYTTRFTNHNRFANYCDNMFENTNYFHSNYRAPADLKNLFITKGCIFAIEGYYVANTNVFTNFSISHKLIALHVVDSKGVEKMLIDSAIITTSIGKKIKSSMNAKGLSSRKNAVSIDDLDSLFTEYIEDYDSTVPFEKLSPSYLETQSSIILESLRANLEEDIVVVQETTESEEVIEVSPVPVEEEYTEDDEYNEEHEDDDENDLIF